MTFVSGVKFRQALSLIPSTRGDRKTGGVQTYPPVPKLPKSQNSGILLGRLPRGARVTVAVRVGAPAPSAGAETRVGGRARHTRGPPAHPGSGENGSEGVRATTDERRPLAARIS